MEEKIKKSLLEIYEQSLTDNKELYMVLVKLCNLLLIKEVLTFKEVNSILDLEKKEGIEDVL